MSEDLTAGPIGTEVRLTADSYRMMVGRDLDGASPGPVEGESSLSWSVADWMRWLGGQGAETVWFGFRFPSAKRGEIDEPRAWADAIVAQVRLLEAARALEVGMRTELKVGQGEWDDRDGSHTTDELDVYLRAAILHLFTAYGVRIDQD